MELLEIIFLLFMAALVFLFAATYTNIQVKKLRPLKNVIRRSAVAVLLLFVAFTAPFNLAVFSTDTLLQAYDGYDVWGIIGTSSIYIFPTIAVPFILAVWLRYRKPSATATT